LVGKMRVICYKNKNRQRHDWQRQCRLLYKK
jgi:hypothetical protein